MASILTQCRYCEPSFIFYKTGVEQLIKKYFLFNFSSVQNEFIVLDRIRSPFFNAIAQINF